MSDGWMDGARVRHAGGAVVPTRAFRRTPLVIMIIIVYYSIYPKL
jgi:hypothetical protein